VSDGTRAHEPASLTVPNDGPWGRAAVASMLVLTLCVLLTFGPTALAVSKAATKEESNAAAIVFALHPYMMVLGSAAALALCAASVRLAILSLRARAWGQTAVLALAGAAVLLASYPLLWAAAAGMSIEAFPVAYRANSRVWFSWHGKASLVGLALAAGLWVGRSWWLQTRRVAAGEGTEAEKSVADCIRRTTGRDILAALPGACLSALAACLAICLPVSFLGLLKMTQPVEVFLATLLLTGCSIAVLGLLLCVALQLVRLVWIGLMRASDTNGKTVAFLGLLAGLFLFILVRWALYLSFGAELRRLGLDLLLDAVLLIGGLFYGLGVSRNLLALSPPHGPADAGELIRLCLLAGALLPVLPVVRRLQGHVRLNRPLVVAGCLVIAVVALALALPFFQTLDDHLTRINRMLAMLILVLTLLLGQAAVPPRAHAWRRKLLALAVLAVPSVAVVAASPYEMGHARVEMNHYSPIGEASSSLLETVLPAPPRTKEATGVTFATPAPQRHPVMDRLSRKRPLIVLMLWDACRPDHMSLYGYRRWRPPLLATTPDLDKHKDLFLRFTNAFTHGTGTTCSMRQVLTARYSSRWMLRTKGVDPFWLNELMRNGYDAFFLNIIGSDYNGISLDAFHRDMPADLKKRLECLACDGCPDSARQALREKEKEFKTDYADLPRAAPDRLAALRDRIKLLECNQQNEQRCVEDLLAFLKTRKDTNGRGVFAYVHPDAAHSPWNRFTEVEDFGDDPKDRYDQCVRYCDYVTGKLIDGLRNLGMWEEAIFIVTADHGTGLMERGTYGGFHPWYEQIHVPLVMKVPGVKGREIDTMVGLMDLGPTIVNVFEPPPAHYEGRSLWPVILHGERWKDDRVLFGMNAFNDCYYLVTDGGWHYIWHRASTREQLFHWRRDPAEKRNLMGLDRQTSARAQMWMNWFLYDYGRDRNYNDPDHYDPPPGQE